MITPLSSISSWRPGQRVAVLVGTAALLACSSLGYAAKAPELPPLTTASGNPRLPGKFVWADLVTDDVPAARKFYARLFGWTFQDVGNYAIAANDQRPICGMFQRERPRDSSAQPRWFAYISVPSVDRAQQTVVKAGGRVVAEPRKMPRRGEQAVFADPEGAVFGVVKSSAGDPEDFLAEPGDWIWIQLLSRNAANAAGFYSKVAGYDVIENSVSNRVSDYVLSSKGYARATVRTIPDKQEKVQPAWLPFVRVKSVSDSVALARQLGGKALLEPKTEVLDGKAAVIADPTGAAIGLLEWSDTLLKGGK